MAGPPSATGSKYLRSIDILLKEKSRATCGLYIQSVDTIRKRELYKTLSILGNGIGPPERRVIEQLSHAPVEAEPFIAHKTITKSWYKRQ
jgi:hypothetical protein